MSKKKQTLALIHGWGFDRRIWEWFVPYLADQWRVICIDLPGYGVKKKLTPANVDQIVRNIEPEIPYGAVLFAWSLGGLIAMQLVCKRKDIKTLVLLASSPCFLNKQGWQHGIKSADFNQLVRQLSKDKIKTLQAFSRLVAMGETYPKPVINKLYAQLGNKKLINNIPEPAILMFGLEILRHTDLRQELAQQECPIRFILGENDILVKCSIGSAIQAVKSDVQAIIISATGHAPFLSRPQETADALIYLTEDLA